MDEKILHELKEMKQFFDEMKLEQAKRLAVLEYQEAERKRRSELLRFCLEIIKSFVAPIVTALALAWLTK